MALCVNEQLARVTGVKKTLTQLTFDSGAGNEWDDQRLTAYEFSDIHGNARARALQ
jgi:hypothetical protein